MVLDRIKLHLQRALELLRSRPATLLLRSPLPFAIFAAAWTFQWWMSKSYPIGKWLFWHYALAWLASSVWAVSCIALGHAVTKRWLRTTLPVLEHVSTSFATGVFAFFLAMNLLGHLQLYGPITFYGLPSLFLLLGAKDSVRSLGRFLRHRRAMRARQPLRPAPLYFWPVVLFGILGCAMVYFMILSPENAQFDSRWKHIAMAEEFAVHGGLRRFPEGSTVGTYPHLSSYLYGWGFMCPKVRLFDHVLIAAHIEFVLFLGSLAALPGLVRLLAPGHRGHLAWAARFLFPGLFVYDSSVSLGADHVGAFFVIPVFTQLIRSWRELDVRHLTLMAVPLCGVGLAKYTCTMLVFPVIGAAVAFRMVWALGARLTKRGPIALRRNWFVGPVAAFGAIALLTLPHWLKNWIWYGDPAYPTLYKHLALRPWTEDARTLFEYGYKEYQFWQPPRTAAGREETREALYNFSFKPNDYPRFHGTVPTFGSLFTLLLGSLFFVRRTGRLWLVVCAVHGSIYIWYWTHHQDRYLQAILPWMAAFVGAMIVKIWHDLPGERWPERILRWSSRTAIVTLVSLQAIWGGDAYFFPTHAMAGSILKRNIDLMGTGYKKDYENRLKVFAPYSDVAKLLPKKSRVMLHDNHVHVGIGATTVSDWGGWQFGISYGRLNKPEAVHDLFVEYGVTHVLWDNQVSKGWDSLAGDLVFFEYALHHTGTSKNVGRVRLAPMLPERPNSSARNDKVTIVGCDGHNYAPGLYQLSDLVVPVFGPKRLKFPKPRQVGDLNSLAMQSGFLVIDPTCPEVKDVAQAKARFSLAAKRKRLHAPRGKRDYELYIERFGAPGASDGAAPEPNPRGVREPDFDPNEGLEGEP